MGKKAVWKRLFAELGEDPDLEYLNIDSTIVRAHQHAAGAKKGGAKMRRSRGGLSTKINISVDAHGNPIRFILTAGQVHDICQAEGLTRTPTTFAPRLRKSARRQSCRRGRRSRLLGKLDPRHPR